MKRLALFFALFLLIVPSSRAAKVEAVALDKTALELTVGQGAMLKVSVVPSDAKVKAILWSSSDRNVVTVSETGEVTATGTGMAVITATAFKSGKSALCAVKVKGIPVEGISLSKSRITLEPGGSKKLDVVISPSNAAEKKLLWKSSDPKVATVDRNGNVIAKDYGTAVIAASAADGGIMDMCTVTVLRHVTGICLNKGSITIRSGESETLTATVSPSHASDKSVVWTSSDPSVAIVDANGKVTAVGAGKVTITAKTVDGGYAAKCIASIQSGPDMVDHGLSVKWASCNLDATRPEEYGGRYQWGGLEDLTGTNSDWSDCPFHEGSDESFGWTKYIPSNGSSYWSGFGRPDNKKVLDSEDDVAHVKLGGKWRMPTKKEWQELLDNCTSEWTQVNGVGGMKFTSKKNGNSIFLPGNDGEGYYWSSSLSDYDTTPGYGRRSTPDSAYYLLFLRDQGWMYIYYEARCYRLSVRPVSD